MNNWKKCKLGDIAEITMGQSPKSEFYNFDNIGMPFLQGNRTFGRKYPYFDTYCTEYKKIAKKGEILFSVRAPVGDINFANNDICIGRGLCSMNAKNGENEFLYYLLHNLRSVIINNESGSVFGSVNKNDLQTIEILLPLLEEQRQIATILSSIDDKIELLHEQNKTLEELAQTLFLNWFKDREFNSTISDFISMQNGFAFKGKDFIDYGNNGVIKIKNISNGIVDIVNTDKISQNTINEVNNKFNINSGDILFAMTGAEIGKMGIVPSTNKKLWLNQRVGMVKERFLGARFLAYIHLTSEFGYDYVINSATGSAQENISATDIENCPFVKLTSEEIVSYSKQLNDFFEKIIFNLGEIQTLENMRDILIPKLLNGEIKITN
ncbi:restriction endonuclease subunit S [Campylobacter jejuni]